MSECFRKHIKKQDYPIHPTTLKFWTHFRNCIYESLKKREWKEVGHNDEWDLCWVEKETVHEIFDRTHLTPTQRINHFRNHYELTRKDLMIKNLKRHKRALEKEGKLDEAASYNFFPTTYNLPSEYSIFCDEFKKSNHAIWIMKPIGKSQGKGIFLFKKLSQISEWKNDPKQREEGSSVENYIVQRYINNPLLIGGKKFDMRIYCLVTSYSPLTAYLYRDGFARFTHHRYDNSDISNSYVHLTNVAIQKHSENYDKNLGGKWDLRTLKLYLASKYGQEKVAECFSDIQKIIIKTLQSVQKVIINDKHCFELYGFDILINDKLKPWVIEVNGSPSMTANTQHDCELKCGLLDDVFTIIDMERILTGQEEQIGGFDLIYKGNTVKNESSLNPSMLGCYNNRLQQLQKLSKIIAAKLHQAALHPKEEAQTDPKKLKTKDGAQSNAFLATSDSVNARKLRSRSIGKTIMSAAMNSTNARTTKTLFNPKPPLATLSRDGRESVVSSDQRGYRFYKGKTVELPPVSTNPNNYTFTAGTGGSVMNSSQSNISQRMVNPVDVIGSTGTNTGTARTSNQLQTPGSELNLKNIQQRPSYQSNLSNSASLYTIRGNGMGNTGQSNLIGNASFSQLSDGLRIRNGKSSPTAREYQSNIYDYDIDNPTSIDRRYKQESYNSHLKEVPEADIYRKGAREKGLENFDSDNNE